jgi:DNA mismatch repair ATPase MutS
MFSIFENFNDDLKVYYKMLKLFERRCFKSTLINKIKDNIRNKAGVETFRQVDKPSTIVDSIANRKNLFYTIFNTLTLWDFQSIIALVRWKQQSGLCLRSWFDALGRIEALASLSVIRFENPEWAMPVIKDGQEAVFQTKGLGHPLLMLERLYVQLPLRHR